MTLRRFTVTETREAMEVTAENLNEVAAWCGGRACHGTNDVEYQHQPGTSGGVTGRRWIGPGRFLVTDGHRWWGVTREEFERMAAQWKETT